MGNCINISRPYWKDVSRERADGSVDIEANLSKIRNKFSKYKGRSESPKTNKRVKAANVERLILSRPSKMISLNPMSRSIKKKVAPPLLEPDRIIEKANKAI